MHFPSTIAEKFGITFKSLSNFWKAIAEEAIHCAAAGMLRFTAWGLCSCRAGAAESQQPLEQIGKQSTLVCSDRSPETHCGHPNGVCTLRTGICPRITSFQSWLTLLASKVKVVILKSLIKQLWITGACCTPNSHLTIRPRTGVWEHSGFDQQRIHFPPGVKLFIPGLLYKPRSALEQCAVPHSSSEAINY